MEGYLPLMFEGLFALAVIVFGVREIIVTRRLLRERREAAESSEPDAD